MDLVGLMVQHLSEVLHVGYCTERDRNCHDRSWPLPLRRESLGRLGAGQPPLRSHDAQRTVSEISVHGLHIWLAECTCLRGSIAKGSADMSLY